ncbi:nucleoid disruption protein [Escherichia phage vb_EcoM-VR5]|uniref:Nucleoid disruption protein n=1 Tax=Escherichia phage vb_EcoM-VR5 TaxID=1567026 RepID=A0A0A7HCP0_9CAUD|nr:Ndd-like nucleoid disruption protein [Escherichia phage vb_EcoM-VR5]AIZ02051.1 nucleoid disruption protein [Escherichia phage vb_EcoM-VR5]
MTTYMTRRNVLSAGATTVAYVMNGEYKIGRPSKETAAQPGFYFFVKGVGENRIVAARFYVGNQRSGQGLDGVLKNIRSARSQANRTMKTNNVLYEVLYVPASKMKPLTTGFGKGQIAMAFTRNHSSDLQTLEEMNRMLADNFKFILQSY